MKYLQGYSDDLINRASTMIEENKLAAYILNRYPVSHTMRNDKALAQYARDIKQRYMKKSAPLSQVKYDPKITLEKGALGLHTFQSKTHGRKMKATSDIKIASLFKIVPEEFLSMIVVHELAHLREKEHNKPFFKLCQHMEPNYHQYEFDLRLYLTHLENNDPLYS